MKPEIDEARLHLAGLAMHAMLTRVNWPSPKDLAILARQSADALLAELEKEPTK